MIEELAVGAQFKIPYIHVVVNNAYLGLIRQSQRGFDMDYHVQLALRQHQLPGARTATASTTSRWPKAWAARRSGSSSPDDIAAALEKAKKLMRRVPGAGGGRGHPGAGHQHLDGRRDRRRRSSSRTWPSAARTPRPPSRCWTETGETAVVPTVLIASDKFKGSLTAAEVAAARQRRHAAGCGPTSTSSTVPVADGGDGTLDAAVAAGFTRVPVTAAGPTGEPVETPLRAARRHARWSRLADVSGLSRLPGGGLAPLTADQPRHRRGDRRRPATPAAAGSSSASAAAPAPTAAPGMVSALGARLLDADGDDDRRTAAPRSPASTGSTWRGLHPGSRRTEIVVACDVDNPLLGDRAAPPRSTARRRARRRTTSRGSTAALAPLGRRWSPRPPVADRRDDPGAGAAGGVGFAALAVLGADAAPGHRPDARPGRLPPAAGRRRTWSSPARGRWTSRPCTARRRPAWPRRPQPPAYPVVAVCGRSLLTAEQLARPRASPPPTA